jgi:hypothetical protein
MVDMTYPQLLFDTNSAGTTGWRKPELRGTMIERLKKRREDRDPSRQLYNWSRSGALAPCDQLIEAEGNGVIVPAPSTNEREDREPVE